jgi:hypothetical protein
LGTFGGPPFGAAPVEAGMKRLLLGIILLALSWSPARAQVQAQGELFIGWGNSPSQGGRLYQDVDCSTPGTSPELTVSFAVRERLDSLDLARLVLRLSTWMPLCGIHGPGLEVAGGSFPVPPPPPPLPPFWEKQAGGCDPGGYSLAHDFESVPWANAPNVRGLWSGQHTVEIHEYRQYRDFGYAELECVIAPAEPIRVLANQEYYAMRVAFPTLGSARCPGCCSSAFLAAELVLSPVGWAHPDVQLTTGCEGFATWNPTAAPPGCSTVPVRQRTWGALKSAYR